MIFAPLIAPYSPDSLDFSAIYAGPSWHHLMGTDELGRDLFSRILFGGRYDLIIASLATLISLVIGFAWGAAAAIGAGWLDNLLMRTADISMAIPGLVIALILVSAFGPSVLSLTIVLGVVLCSLGGAGDAGGDPERVEPRVHDRRSRLLLEPAAAHRLRGPAERDRARTRPGGDHCCQRDPARSDSRLCRSRHPTARRLLGDAACRPAYNDDHYSIWYGLFPGLVIFIFILSLNTIADHMQQALDPRRRG